MPELQKVNNQVGPPVITVVFSKDRPLQLDATLRSFFSHCKDPELTRVMVLYVTSHSEIEILYHNLAKDYPQVEFHRETFFANDLLSALSDHHFLLSLVDDNIFVRRFSIEEMITLLRKHTDAIGFSLRLGKNTTYCYSLDCQQELPQFELDDGHILIFNWTKGKADFNYPLELSSSLYALDLLLQLLKTISFQNPNTLESELAARAQMLTGLRPKLLCYDKSRAFCAPLNKVQSTFPNRACNYPDYSASALVELFKSGKRIATKSYESYTPKSCHEEINLILE